ncbi:MAG: thiamine pyrophosphate-dependent enzyme [Desulfobacteraceae bacterium]|nr:thiamine pyrophosphate-dependent enzyme [Desulfobacteraceae bacterium]
MINRLEATRYLVAQLSDEPIIASCGNPKFDLYGAAANRKANFYMWNSMGMASSIGLGLALARPDRKVIVLDGDGAILMNLNSLTTAASKAPGNLVHVIWDNEQYQLTGGQRTHTSETADIGAIAKGAGFNNVRTIKTMEGFKRALTQALHKPGPWILVAKTDASGAPERPPKSPVYIKHQFMEALKR